MLNSLCKIPLFVILEEQLCYPDEIDEELSLIAEELQAKPASDGTLLNWQKKLLESCPKRGWYFSSRMRKIFTPAILEDLGKCVALRNQYHHPPYDLPSFLEAMTWFLDKHETMLRRSFDQLCFIKVKELQYSADGFKFKCHVLEGATRTFPMNEIKTSLAPEKLNSDYVVLYDKKSDKSLPFKTYLETKEQAHKSLNIGLYNRPTSHGIEYDYVFSE